MYDMSTKVVVVVDGTQRKKIESVIPDWDVFVPTRKKVLKMCHKLTNCTKQC